MIAAVFLLSADIVFEQLASSRTATARAAIERDDAQNATASIRRWVRQVDVSPSNGPRLTPHAFSGDSTTTHFTSWCATAGNWERECDVSLRVVTDSGGSEIIAESSNGDSARVPVHYREIALRYLIDAQDGGHWSNNWPRGPTVPQAIGVVSKSVSQSDTVVWRIGARG